MKCVIFHMGIARLRASGVRAYLDDLSTFFLCTNGQFVHFLAHFGNVKEQMKKIGSEKSAPRYPFDRGV